MSNTPLTGNVRHRLHGAFMRVLSSVTPVPTTSHFEEKRTLTPAEFLQAGAYLVETYPSWEWYGGVQSKRRSYLGEHDKQCLVVRKVPCNQEPQIHSGDLNTFLEGEWVCAGDVNAQPPDEIPDIDAPEPAVPDIDDLEDDVSVLPPAQSNRRVYDLYITYDIVYKVPRFWLVGYGPDMNVLTCDQMSADLSQEHAGMTITWDLHPHEDFNAMSIHPCQHAHVMKELLDTMKEQGKTIAVDHYLVVFLKFIIALIPTIEFDYAMGM